MAVGELIGHSSIKSAARMNGAVVIFVDSVAKANKVVETGIVVNDSFVSVSPLTTPAARVTISNVPPFIGDEPLIRELSKHGKIVSAIRKLPSGFKSPLMRHVVGYRRQVNLILNKKDAKLNLVFSCGNPAPTHWTRPPRGEVSDGRYHRFPQVGDRGLILGRTDEPDKKHLRRRRRPIRRWVKGCGFGPFRERVQTHKQA